MKKIWTTSLCLVILLLSSICQADNNSLYLRYGVNDKGKRLYGAKLEIKEIESKEIYLAFAFNQGFFGGEIPIEEQVLVGWTGLSKSEHIEIILFLGDSWYLGNDYLTAGLTINQQVTPSVFVNASVLTVLPDNMNQGSPIIIDIDARVGIDKNGRFQAGLFFEGTSKNDKEGREDDFMKFGPGVWYKPRQGEFGLQFLSTSGGDNEIRGSYRLSF